MGKVKHAVYLALLRAGYEVRPVWDDWRRVPLLAPRPSTIIDIGVGRGTPYLYDAFPDADLMLIEPLREFDNDIQQLLKRRRGTSHPVAVGAVAGEMSINVVGEPTRSSFHAPSSWRGEMVTEERQISVTTVDALVAKHQPQAPYLMKIDTEGHEFEVLKGATETLSRTECVIAEVSVSKRFYDDYRFADVLAAMHERGFGFADVLTLARRHGRVTFADVVFLPYRILDNPPAPRGQAQPGTSA